MVDPISLTTVGIVAAATGLAVGRVSQFRRKKTEKQEILVKRAPIHFVAVAGEAEPSTLTKTAKEGEPVFINIKPLRVSPEKRKRFLIAISQLATQEALSFNEVSPDLFLLADRKQLVRVKTISEVKSQMEDRTAIDSVIDSVANR